MGEISMEDVKRLDSEIKDIKNNDIAKLEKKIDSLDERTRSVELNLAENNLLTKQSIDTTRTNAETNKELNETMKNVSITLVKLSDKIDNSNREHKNELEKFGDKLDSFESRVDNKFNDTDNKIASLNKESKRIDDKSKWDFLPWIKSKIPYLVGCGVLYGFIELIKLAIENVK